MKKSLVAGLSALALTLVALTGCGGGTDNPTTKPDTENPHTSESTEAPVEVVEIGDINRRGDGFQSALHGQKVKLRRVNVYDSFGHTAYIQKVTNMAELDLSKVALEIRSESDLTSLGIGAEIDVVGTVDLDGRRIILNNAEVKVIKPSKGEIPNDMIIIPSLNRGNLTTMATRFCNGLGYMGDLQVAEKFPTITAEAETVVKVAFPGEDLDLTKENNPFVMNFIVPAGLPKTTIDFLNNTRFNGVEAGDTIRTIGALSYSGEGSSKWELVLNQSIGGNADYVGGKVRTPDIYKTYDELLADTLTYYLSDEALAKLPRLEADDENGESTIFSYVPRLDMFNEENDHLMFIDITSYDVNKTYDLLVKNIQDQALLIDAGGQNDPETNIQVHTFVTTEDASLGQDLYLEVTNLHKTITIALQTVKPREIDPITNYATFEEFSEGYSKVVDRAAASANVGLIQQAGFKSLIPDMAPAFTKNEGVTLAGYEVDASNIHFYTDQHFPVLFSIYSVEFDVDAKYYPTEKDAKGEVVIPEAWLKIREAALKEILTDVVEAGFYAAKNTALVDSDHNPTDTIYNHNSGEAMDFGWLQPEANEKTGVIEGKYGVIVITNIMSAVLKDRVVPME